MIKVVTWCKRFLHNSRYPLHPTLGTLTSSELSHFLLCILKNVQRTSFVTEIKCLENSIPIPNVIKLTLSPFFGSRWNTQSGWQTKKQWFKWYAKAFYDSVNKT
ncbi:integrase_H2C2 domain-containing protein [Nephila pilipes]|uniref:Integrase_H2C2 domain-containing protein n=1 Tax=Nephila pilipes TaxID=299642 RepID=A0A8X6T2U5_NEPPI|nr:integrase_H2C2 domain-containing protein [Nephila pilipes]